MPPHVHGDPLKRAWVEVSGANPVEVARHKPTLVSFLAFNRERDPRLVGTGFVVAGNPTGALVATARHVLAEGVPQAQDLGRRSAPSAIFVPERSALSLKPDHLKAVWIDGTRAGLLNVICASDMTGTDLAICVVVPQEHEPPPFAPMSIPLHTGTPTVGAAVQMVSIDEMSVTESEPPQDRRGQGQTLTISHRVSIRFGVVTGVYPRGLRQHNWPCFTTSIPAEPGMSGGFVTMPVTGETVAACGVVSADFSSDDARADPMIAGESLIASSWPALALPLPEVIGQPAHRTLLEMVRCGDLDMPIGGVDHIAVITGPDGRAQVSNLRDSV